MQRKSHKRNWEDLADVDPLWAILSNSSCQHNGWDVTTFFQSGEHEVSLLMERTQRLGLHFTSGAVLDFGCGVGRLTRAFSRRFETCYGVDISERMIEQAQRLNQDYPNCHFVVNVVDNLHIFPDEHFDLIYTNLVLQHLPRRETIVSFIREFLRTLRPNGLLIFQLPSYMPLWRRVQWRRRAYAGLRSMGMPHEVLYYRLRLNPISMTFIPVPAVTTIVRDAGGMLAFVDTKATSQYQSSIYYVTTRAASGGNLQQGHAVQ